MTTFDQWIDEMSKEIFLPGEEEKKAITRYFEMFDEELGEDETSQPRLKRK